MSAFNRSSDRNQDTTLYVGNLDQQVNEALLYELFIQFAPVKSIHLPKDKITNTHQAYGFVELKTIQDTEYVEKLLDGLRIYGKSLRIKRSGADKFKNLDVGANLFVKNLSPLVDEELLTSTFEKFGTFIKPPYISRDDAGASKGFGFIYYADFSSSDNALNKMNGIILLNNEIKLDYMRRKDGEKHGSAVERKLAENAKQNNYRVNGESKKRAK